MTKLKWKIPQLLVIVYLFRTGFVSGQISETPSVRNFSKEIYGASSQNWSVTQDRDGNIFVANTLGLLEYDGVTWMLYPSPGGNIIRAVAADSTGRIFTSGYKELGYWTRDDFGTLHYTSLNEKAQDFFTPNVEYWNIIIRDQKVMFQAFTQILVYENDIITPIQLKQFSNSTFLTDDKLLVNVMNAGIFELKGEQKIPWLTGDFFTGKIVRFILSAGNGQYLVGTASHGIFITDKARIKEWNSPENEYFKKNQINKGYLLPDGDILIGTILDGVTLLQPDGRLKWRLNSNKGLQNNTVLGLFIDRDKNIWLALDRGLDMLAVSSRSGISFYPVENVGAVYTAAIRDNLLYLGTNQGLFVSNRLNGKERFELVEGTQGQVWDIGSLDGQLILGHNAGTFLVSGNESTQVSGVSGGFSMIPDPFDPGNYIQCTYSNLVKFVAQDGKIRQSEVIFNFNELIRFIEFDHLGNLWASHMHKGLFRLRFNAERDSVTIMKRYDDFPAFNKKEKMNVFKVENRIVFATGDSLYTYDDLHDTIISLDPLNRNLGKYAGVVRIIPAGPHKYWMVTRQHIGLLHIEDMYVEVIREYPIDLFNNQLIRDYENIITVNDTLSVICLENGFAWLETGSEPIRIPIIQRVPALRSMVINDRNGKQYPLTIKTDHIKIPYHRNSIRFRFALPHYTTDKFGFQWYMEGLSPGWSNKITSPRLTFDRLPVGKYILKVKATDSWGNESGIFSVQVTVSPPWYGSFWAKLGYILFIVILLMVFRYMIISKTRKKEQRDREEKEKELITLKNEKLQAEISFKSKELANSTMAIIKKNEFLLDMKETLLKQKSMMGQRFPEKYFSDLMKKIEENLTGQDDWNIFENNFEQAHEAFIRNLRDKFPDLTPGDIRLCAFLRMNLSSKEIAPLLGISIRGVENHRYRLRKKMELEHDDNLIEIILKM